jgi:hypothetical protein
MISCLHFYIYLVFWQWKNEMNSSLHFTFGILAMGKMIDFLSAFYIGVREMKNIFCIPVCVVLVSWQWKTNSFPCLRFASIFPF